MDEKFEDKFEEQTIEFPDPRVVRISKELYAELVQQIKPDDRFVANDGRSSIVCATRAFIHARRIAQARFESAVKAHQLLRTPLIITGS